MLQRFPTIRIQVLARRFNNAGFSKDYYAVLGVSKGSTQRQIKAAYYQLSKKYHPDVAGNDSTAKAKFLEVNEAWECLRDTNRRKAYDNQMSGGGGRYPGDGTNPFRDFQEQRRQNYGSNPFYSQKFTEEEYRRVWEQFNRMRQERERYDQNMYERRQQAFDEYARRRAERWKQFHERYPNGPPGSFRWEWKWTNSDQDPRKAWGIVRKLMIVYMGIFFVVTFFRVLFLNTDEREELKRMAQRMEAEQAKSQESNHERIRKMISTMPRSEEKPKFGYIYEAPNESAPVRMNEEQDEYTSWKPVV
ncbi:unnamed protein product [Caenorhabditis auriculariae]|uniref:J domain-containing protein n=1 Tax=Caenorhabditis auriculariae TaxID=2777116 RepID=A0A8S1GUU1_9PELO|nr:unnamed protein product [Caenorhabditis auriculariae]